MSNALTSIATRDNARPPSLPEPLTRLIDDHHRPRQIDGFIPSGWVPPPRLSGETKLLLADAIAPTRSPM